MTAATIVPPKCPAWCGLTEHEPLTDFPHYEDWSYFHRLRVWEEDADRYVELFWVQWMDGKYTSPIIDIAGGQDLDGPTAHSIAGAVARAAEILDAMDAEARG